MSVLPGRWYGPLGLSLILIIAAASFRGGRNPAVESLDAAGAQGSTTLDDQVDLNVTVYNSDIALVRDVRTLELPPGTSDLSFMDIAATVNPSTVHFRSLSEPSRVSVLEQNYEYDLLEPDKLLKKYVGRDVTLVRTRQVDGTSREEEVTAHLLSYNTQPVWRIDGEVVTGLHADHIRFPELPDTLYTRPTLIWTLANTGASRHRVEAAYLAGKLSWNADYVLTVARDDKAGDMDGWVTLTNGSGTAFRNARLQLVAGELNRVRENMARLLRAEEMALRAPAAAPQMAEEAFSEYHLYTLARKTTIGNNETKQVSMLSGTGFPLRKRYVVNGNQFYYHNFARPGAPVKDAVEVFYQFKNEEKGGLGMPMPAGTVRVYQSDSNGGVHFVGEDRIAHTPKDEVLNLKVGNAFDVVCERSQVDFEKIAANVYEVEYAISLRNRKTAPVTIEVNEPVGAATWRMMSSTHKWIKTAAFAAQFMVPVEAGAETVLKFRVRVNG